MLRWLLERQFSIDLLRQLNQLRIAIKPEAAALAAQVVTPEQVRCIVAGLERTETAERGYGDTRQADISFYVAIVEASQNDFFAQFHEVVATALRTSVRFTNRIEGQTANLAEHAAVKDTTLVCDPDGARAAMRNLIGEVLAAVESSKP